MNKKPENFKGLLSLIRIRIHKSLVSKTYYYFTTLCVLSFTLYSLSTHFYNLSSTRELLILSAITPLSF